MRKILFSVVAAGLMLGGVEAAMRVATPREWLLYDWEREDGALERAGPRKLPRPGKWNERHDGPYRWQAVVNEQTFREDHAIPAARPAGQKRILALGDSWIFGTSVTQGRTIPDRMESGLEAAGWGADVEVINAGVPSFSGFDMLWRWESLGRQFSVDGVLLGQPHNVKEQASRLAVRDAWHDAVGAAPPSDIRIYRVLRRIFDEYRRPPYAVPPSGEAADASAADLEALVRAIAEEGLPVWFLAMPTRYGHTGDPTADARLHERLRAAGAIVGGHDLPERECWGFVDLGHPSEGGAAALAAVAVELVLTPDSGRTERSPPATSPGALSPGTSGNPDPARSPPGTACRATPP